MNSGTDPITLKLERRDFILYLSCILSVLGDSGKSQTDGDLMQGVEISWGLDD